MERFGWRRSEVRGAAHSSRLSCRGGFERGSSDNVRDFLSPNTEGILQGMNAQLLLQARQLSTQDQLELAEVLWEDIATRGSAPQPSAAQKMELDKRLAEHEANPDDVVSWSEVKAAAFARIGQ